MRIIAGALGGRNLKTVEGPGYRPATAKVREAIFSMLSLWCTGCRPTAQPGSYVWNG